MNKQSGAIAMISLMFANPSCAEEPCNIFTEAGSHSGMEMHLPNGPIFTVFMHQHDRDRPQYNKDEIYIKVKPFCRRDDCELYIKELPQSHMSGMDFTFTCEEGRAAP